MTNSNDCIAPIAPTTPTRTIHHANALTWLEGQGPIVGASLVTSLPDVSEFPSKTLPEWKEWFIAAAALVLTRTPAEGLTIFYQSDIKRDGLWVDKGFLCLKAAEQVGHELIAHKIVCRAPAGGVSFGRPGYSHLICFSKTVRPDLAKSFADVLPEAGDVTWTRGMGIKACELACRMILAYTKSHTVVDPFCGHGSVLAVANQMGLNAVGVELSLKRANKARELIIQNGQPKCPPYR